MLIPTPAEHKPKREIKEKPIEDEMKRNFIISKRQENLHVQWHHTADIWCVGRRAVTYFPFRQK